MTDKPINRWAPTQQEGVRHRLSEREPRRYVFYIHYIEAPAESDGDPAVHLDTASSYDLIAKLLAGCTDAPRRYTHVWANGDLVVWDNRITLHSATDPAKSRGPRLMHRVRLDGSHASNADCMDVWNTVGPPSQAVKLCGPACPIRVVSKTSGT